MSYDLFIVDKDVPEPEWFDVCERDGEHVRTAHGHYFNYTYNLSAFFTDYKVHDFLGRVPRPLWSWVNAFPFH